MLKDILTEPSVHFTLQRRMENISHLCNIQYTLYRSQLYIIIFNTLYIDPSYILYIQYTLYRSQLYIIYSIHFISILAIYYIFNTLYIDPSYISYIIYKSQKSFILSFTACSQGSLRLVGGTSLSGRLEICYNNVWGTICDDQWNQPDAAVACRKLGFSEAGEWKYYVEWHALQQLSLSFSY